MIRYVAVLSLLVCTISLSGADVDFDRDIRPILSENCFFCHGPDVQQRQADFRLDVREEAMAAIEPSDRGASELFSRITSGDAETVMPPPDSNRELTVQQIELIGKWIDQGANWTRHWAFRDLIAPQVPDVEPFDHAPIRNSIDAFAQRELRMRGMEPMPEADRRTLIRRLSLDLRGLPPKPDEVEEFLADEDDRAYERLVERMLGSPAYGQRMAWNWLDAARYADSNGYQGDRERTMWPWQDWVVRAFNDNIRYDDLTVWQLAGDLLPNATDEQRMATGFCRNHMINGEGGRIAEENRVEYVMDMTETMGTIWLGLTLNCCRCHDHKYDPITNQEYYQFFSFFNQTPVTGGGGDPQTAPNMPVPSQSQRVRLAKLASEIKNADARLSELARTLSAKQVEWEAAKAKELANAKKWQTIKPEKAVASSQRLTILEDHSVLASGPNPDNDAYTLQFKTDLPRMTGLRLEALKHPTMTAGGLARSNSGNFVLTDIEIAVLQNDDQRVPVSITSAGATYEQGGLRITHAFDEDPTSGWAVHEGRMVDREHAAVFRFGSAVEIPAGSAIEVVLRHDSVHKSHNLGRFRIGLTDHDTAKLDIAADALSIDLKIPADERTDEQQERIRKAHRASDPQYLESKKRRDGIAKARSDLVKSIPKVMIMDETERRETFMLSRGLYSQPTAKVTAGLPAFLSPRIAENENGTLNRLTLARWLVSDENPLTARVTVNRFWQQVFGIGVVKTPENFGRQGEIPLHMDLLNWLAADFRDGGWNVKRLMHTIVTSHVYRQSSRVRSPAAFQTDPENRLLARGARFRLPSWMLRDQALAASGLLSRVDGGAAVNTYQPEGIWEEASFGTKKYTRDSGEKLYRRSLYTFWRRIIAPTMFFDNATRQTCTVKEGRTNTPLHALQTLNNVAYVEAGRALAELALKSEPLNDAARIDFVFALVLARKASQAEQDVLLHGLSRTRREFESAPEEAAKLASVGESSRDDAIDVVEHASWTALCLAVLNLDETLNRE